MLCITAYLLRLPSPAFRQFPRRRDTHDRNAHTDMSLNSFRTGLERITSSSAGKWTVFVIGALLVFSLVFSGLGNNLGSRRGAAGPNGAGGSGGTLATVNGDAITQGDYDQSVSSLRGQAEQFGQHISVMQSAALHNAALEQLITAKLELQQAQKLGLTASDADIARARQQVVTQSGVAEKLGLKPAASLSDIDAALAKNGQPTIEDRLPDEALRQNVLLDKLQTLQANQVNVSEQDARAFYKEYHTRHILIGNKTRSDVQAQAQAQQIITKAASPGADFAALAKQYSDDPGTKTKGGDDGFIGQDNGFNGYVPEFTKAAIALAPGQVSSAPVKSPQFGYFVIKLDGVRDNLPKDFDKNKAQYIAQVKQQKQGEARQASLTALKNAPGTKIVVNDPALRADRAMAQAAQAPDPVAQQSGTRTALADYQNALKTNPPMSQAGEINVGIGQAYQALGQPAQAITAYETALKSTDDAQLRLALGTLYLAARQPDKAAAQFQSASTQAWDDPQVHQQLAATYATMKRPDLLKQEQQWQMQYQQRQAQSTGPMGGGLPPGVTVAPPPAAANASAAPVRPASTAPQNVPDTGVKVVPSDAPGAATVVPVKK